MQLGRHNLHRIHLAALTLFMGANADADDPALAAEIREQTDQARIQFQAALVEEIKRDARLNLDSIKRERVTGIRQFGHAGG